ncbi:Plakophilin-2 [Plecturocebus cupreus]
MEAAVSQECTTALQPWQQKEKEEKEKESGPQNWYSNTSAIFYWSKQFQSLPRFKDGAKILLLNGSCPDLNCVQVYKRYFHSTSKPAKPDYVVWHGKKFREHLFQQPPNILASYEHTLRKVSSWPGAVVHACNPSTFGGRGRQITRTKIETILANTGGSILQPPLDAIYAALTSSPYALKEQAAGAVLETLLCP